MSQINGDKSRFHRERKQNIKRRLRTRELLDAAEKATAGKAAAGKKLPVIAAQKTSAPRGEANQTN